MKGNQISQSPTDNGIMDIKADSVEVQRRKIKLTFPHCFLKNLHYCSLINSIFLFIDFVLFGRVQWEGPETVRLYAVLVKGGGIMVCWGLNTS